MILTYTYQLHYLTCAQKLNLDKGLKDYTMKAPRLINYVCAHE